MAIILAINKMSQLILSVFENRTARAAFINLSRMCFLTHYSSLTIAGRWEPFLSDLTLSLNFGSNLPQSSETQNPLSDFQFYFPTEEILRSVKHIWFSYRCESRKWILRLSSSFPSFSHQQARQTGEIILLTRSFSVSQNHCLVGSLGTRWGVYEEFMRSIDEMKAKIL